jgi:hypothetical protein
MGKKSIKKIAAKDADQYMLRLPPGLRDRVGRRAAENGRSMNTEIVEAIEQHLTRADRVTQLWEFFGKHQENIESIPVILDAVERLERYLLDDVAPEVAPPDDEEHLSHRIPDVITGYNFSRIMASIPRVTAEQVQTIKTLLKETEANERWFLTAMGVDRIEDIRGFEQAMAFLNRRRNRTPT